ncbi:MAG: hypothetical protein ABUK08_00385 [Candidatus Humimicrobiaceae bacterium]
MSYTMNANTKAIRYEIVVKDKLKFATYNREKAIERFEETVCPSYSLVIFGSSNNEGYSKLMGMKKATGTKETVTPLYI